MDTQDRQQILDLISGYSYSYDGNDIDALVQLFDEEAVTNVFVPSQDRPFHTTTTLSQLREEIGKRRASLARKGIQTRHFMANTVLTVVSHDRILGRTVFLVIWQRRGKLMPRVMHSGIYEDEFLRTPKGWRFVRRDLRLDHELPSHPVMAYFMSWMPKFLWPRKSESQTS
jgi:3-phenylpropionate/cinnamic acid dioxygenase small subunit